MILKNKYFLLSIFFLLFSCNETKESPVIEVKNTPIEEIKDTTEPEVEQWLKDYITDGNVREKLLDYGKNNPENKVTIFTNYGKMKLKLYDETPLHRANFVMLSKKKIFHNTLFYRVIKNFMIQGGNSDDTDLSERLFKIGSYGIPNEISTKFPHKTGALAMAVPYEQQERDKKSSNINFYIVKGRKLSRTYLDNLNLTEKNKKTYLRKGGAAHLDGDYTVFGEVTSGFSVLSKISNVKTNKGNWPKKRIIIDSIVAYK